MNNLVPTKELCEQLRDAGYPQESEFWWWTMGKWDEHVNVVSTEFKLSEKNDRMIEILGEHQYLAAPLTDEILAQLPYTANSGTLEIRKSPKGYVANYNPVSKLAKGKIHSSGSSLSECLAMMYLYLKKEGLI